MVDIPEQRNIQIESLTTDGNNPNTMKSAKFEALKKNLERFGFIVPIITNKQFVIADGEHRWKAAKELGMTHVPIIQLDIEEVDRRILRQVLNKLRGEHDPKLDQSEYAFLDEEESLGHLAALMGEQERNLKRAMEGPKIVEDEYKPTVIPKYKIKTGDIYKLGNHRLICGDATIVNTLHELMVDDEADAIFTDPPYNLAFSGTIKNQFETLTNDQLADEEYSQFANNLLRTMKGFCKLEASYYICIDYRNYPLYATILKDLQLDLMNCIVWDKVFAGMGFKYRHRHEFIIYAGFRDKVKWTGSTVSEDFVKVEPHTSEAKTIVNLDMKGVSIPLKDGRYVRMKLEKDNPMRVPLLEVDQQITLKPDRQDNTNIWEGFSMNYFSQRELENSEGIVHPTMKPLKMIADFICNSTDEEEIVLDVCGGSGSTLIACEQTNRAARIVEIDPVYCNTIIDRWEKFTGEMAEKIQ